MSPLQARVNFRPWPYAPRPFDDEAFGSWFGRVASRYQVTVEMAWEINGLGPLPALTSVGWILFAPLDESALDKLAALARIDAATIASIQTPDSWMVARRRLPFCFRCLVINPVDVSTPYWKRAWLNPSIIECCEHGAQLETAPSSVLRRAGNMQQLISSVGRYRRDAVKRRFRRGR
ncbi:TniQ family protein [Paraburkholderia bengalensis]|uniref:TniQ family protein n=1 Tax=Paraburkholderia bengalensis TaxID=2747562 RepID=A0ABU8J7C7_9BURK